jgi:hypothetical protein
LVLDDFYGAAYELFAFAATPGASVDTLRAQFDEKSTNDYVVTFMRYLTTMHLRLNSKQYTPYLPPGHSLESFIRHEVQPINHESDYLQCIALATELGIGIRIEYLDHNSKPLTGYVLPPKAAPIIFLLYRPGMYEPGTALHALHRPGTRSRLTVSRRGAGHYDILYPKEPTAAPPAAPTPAESAATKAANAAPMALSLQPPASQPPASQPPASGGGAGAAAAPQ